MAQQDRAGAFEGMQRTNWIQVAASLGVAVMGSLIIQGLGGVFRVPALDDKVTSIQKQMVDYHDAYERDRTEDRRRVEQLGMTIGGMQTAARATDLVAEALQRQTTDLSGRLSSLADRMSRKDERDGTSDIAMQRALSEIEGKLTARGAQIDGDIRALRSTQEAFGLRQTAQGTAIAQTQNYVFETLRGLSQGARGQPQQFLLPQLPNDPGRFAPSPPSEMVPRGFQTPVPPASGPPAAVTADGR